MLVTLVFCVALLIQIKAVGFGCNVQYCQYCSYPNFCGLCNDNYILMINPTSSQPYCEIVTCNLNNCNKCLSSNICSECDPGFTITSSGVCTISVNKITCSSNCLSCNSSSSCTLCKYGYTNINGNCMTTNGNQVANCQAYFFGYACQICSEGYAVNIAYQCSQMSDINECNVVNCRTCNSNNFCDQCSAGFQLNATSGSCDILTCNIQYCVQCQTGANETQCSQCQPSYYLDKQNNQCVPKYVSCGVQNCISCSDTDICAYCRTGYYYSPLVVNGNTIGSTCELYTQSQPIISDNYKNTQYYPVQNCQIFGAPIPGSSTLSVGCTLCDDYFVNVAGYCVANLTISNYVCNIPNCLYCVQNNYCGQCADGFVAYLGNHQNCVPYFSPIPNCQFTGLFQQYCVICQDGYAKNIMSECVKYWPLANCNITGCQYCLQISICASCRTGYTLNNTQCSPNCSIKNCYQCNSTTTCGTCDYNYSAVASSTGCQLTSSISETNCSVFGSQCSQCNKLQCTTCEKGYTLSNGQCCQTPTQNVYQCSKYESACSSICIQCEIGFNIVKAPLNFGNQCINLECSIPNCAYCFGNKTCTLCMQNYTVKNGTCVSYSPSKNCVSQNCVQCNTTSGECISCLSGYTLYFGQCVCPFQNCLKCMANSYCSICAYPMTPGIWSAGCLPQAIDSSDCHIQNCQQCQNRQNCAVCNEGFSLSSAGLCIQNQCEANTNCQLCSFSGNLCFLCKNGTYQQQIYQKQCYPVPFDYKGCFVQGCSFCQTSTTCEVCQPLYYKGNDNLCYEYDCTDNCLICYSNNTCSICQYGFYRSLVESIIQCLPMYQPMPNCSSIKDCIKCTNINNEINCEQCYFGLIPNSEKNQCVPNQCKIDNCQFCTLYSQQACFICEQGYSLTPYLQCVLFNPAILTPECNVYNCLYCSKQNYCIKCLGHSNLTEDGLCINNQHCSIKNCGNCTSPYDCINCLVNFEFSYINTCTPACNIGGCQICLDMTTCKVCQGDFVPQINGTTCQCPYSFVYTNGTTCQCPSGFNEFEGSCYNCSGVGNCSLCTSTLRCGICKDTFTLVDGQCLCPDNTFQYINDSCLCTNQTIRYRDTCIACEVENCLQCSSQDFCIKCINNFMLDNGTCLCPDTFSEQNDTCVCTNPNAKNYSNVCYECKIDNCSYCIQDQVCGQCINNLTLMESNTSCQCSTGQTFYNGYCYTCNSTLLPYCTICGQNNYCEDCLTTFMNINGMCLCMSGQKQYNNQCVSCDVQNCQTCSQANICDSCSSGFSKLSNSSCIECNIQNCLSCSLPGYCSSCQKGYQVNTYANKCVICTVPNCLTCSSNNVCTQCVNSYSFSTTLRNCVQCRIVGCKLCSQENICATCLTGYSLNSDNACNLCSYPCLTCNNQTKKCQTCQSPYSYYALQNGTCFTCTTQFCTTCQISTPNICLECAPSYVLQPQTSQCIYKCADTNCMKCEFSNICTQCVQGYTPNGTTGCVKCDPLCSSCSQTNPSICLQCYEGFYIQKGICKLCPFSYCKTCTQSACLTFKQQTGMTPVSFNGTINAFYCNFGCLSCSPTNPNACSICDIGFTLSNQNCIPCAGNCKTCSNSQPAMCYTCYSNANLIDNYCMSCQENCLTCKAGNSSACVSCPIGYFLQQQSCNKTCPNNCKICTNQTVCISCISGFSINSLGICLPCLSTCRQCSQNNQGLCLNCGQGLYLSGNVCQLCPGNCTVCTDNGCLTCSAGFYLTQSLSCTQSCLPPCSTCLSGSPLVCYSCIISYVFDQSTGNCVPSNLNYICPFSTVLSNNKCLNCNSTSNCGRCSTSNSTQCTNCLSGRYLDFNLGTCQLCPENCSSCSSSNNCLSCKARYVATVQNEPSSINCQPCQSPCLTCINNPQTCSSCMENSTQVGWKCIFTYNFGFIVQLNTNFTIFYQNYGTFLAIIANAFNSKDLGIVSISNITSGSVIVSGNVSVANQSNSSQTLTSYNNFVDVLANGSSIANMTIISSFISVNGGDTPINSKGADLTLILGICIPVAIILLGVISYFLCLRTRNNKPPVDYLTKDFDDTVPPETNIRQTFQMARSQHGN